MSGEGQQDQCYPIDNPTPTEVKKKVLSLVQKSHIKTKRTKEQLRKRLKDSMQLFMAKGMKVAGTVITKHSIKLKEQYRVQHFPPQRLSAVQKAAQEGKVNELFEMGVIRRSSSPWAARMLLVKKQDRSWRQVHRLQI